MKLIILHKPMVLRSSLDDMTASQKEIALDLLTNRKLLIPGTNGLRFIGNKHETPKFFLYGSEAVCYYRQSLGLPDVSIRTIDPDNILQDIDDYDTLYDILHLLHRVDIRNERIIKLRDLDVPNIILWNEDRMLPEYVEFLQDNNWCGKPVINRYDTADEGEEPEWHEEIRKSLIDIGYDLAENNHRSHSTAAE